jgi:hypothetical protein
VPVLQKQTKLICLVVLGILLLAHGGHFYAIDNYTVYLTGKAFLAARLDIKEGLGAVQGIDGRHYGMYSFGLPLLQSAFMLVGGFADAYWPNGFRSLAGPRASLLYPETFGVFAASLVSCLFGAFTIATMWSVSTVLGHPRRTAAALVAMALLSTQLWPAARDSFPQIVVAFCILGAIGHLMTWRDPAFRRAPLVVGGFLGLLVAVRPFDAMLVLPPIGLYALWQDRDEIVRRRHPFTRSLVVMGLPILVSGFVLGAHNAVRFGSPWVLLPATVTTISFNNPILDGVYGLLLSAHRGIVFYSPPVILGIVGLVMLARRRPAEALLFATIIVAFVLTYATYALWEAGVSWGGRFLVPIVPLALLPVGELLQRHRVLSGTVLVLAAVGFVVQVAGTTVDFHRVATQLATAAASGEVGITNPILAHWASLRDGQNLDWLLLRIKATSGWMPALAYAAIPILLIAYGTGGLWREGEATRSAIDAAPDEHLEPMARTARLGD